MNIKSLIKGFVKIILLLILIIIIGIVSYLTVRWFEFQKVYNSFEDWKLAHKIEKTLYKMADEARKTKKLQSIELVELTKERLIDKICVAGPYSRDINKTMSVNWKQSKIWNYQVVYYDTLNSIFLIHDNEIIPIKVKINTINDIYMDKPCINANNSVKLDLIKNNSKIYLKITN